MLSEGENRKMQARYHRLDEHDDFGILLATASYDTIGCVTVKPIVQLLVGDVVLLLPYIKRIIHRISKSIKIKALLRNSVNNSEIIGIFVILPNLIIF